MNTFICKSINAFSLTLLPLLALLFTVHQLPQTKVGATLGLKFPSASVKCDWDKRLMSHLFFEKFTQDLHALVRHLLVLHIPDSGHSITGDDGHEDSVLPLHTKTALCTLSS